MFNCVCMPENIQSFINARQSMYYLYLGISFIKLLFIKNVNLLLLIDIQVSYSKDNSWRQGQDRAEWPDHIWKSKPNSSH